MAGTSACPVDGCVAGTGNPAATGAAQSDPTATTDPAQTGRAPATRRADQPGSTGAPGADQPGLLPDVVSGTPLDGVVGGSGDRSSTTAPGSSKGGGSGTGGLPPVQVPPIGPLPGVSIGG